MDSTLVCNCFVSIFECISSVPSRKRVLIVVHLMISLLISDLASQGTTDSIIKLDEKNRRKNIYCICFGGGDSISLTLVNSLLIGDLRTAQHAAPEYKHATPLCLSRSKDQDFRRIHCSRFSCCVLLYRCAHTLPLTWLTPSRQHALHGGSIGLAAVRAAALARLPSSRDVQ